MIFIRFYNFLHKIYNNYFQILERLNTIIFHFLADIHHI